MSRAGGWLAAIAVAAVAAIAAALVSQHAFGMEPCAWCVLQRLLFLLMVVACAAGAWAPGRVARVGAALAADALALAGAGAALWQHFVASLSDQCGVSFADTVIMALSLHEIAPWMFLADALWRALGRNPFGHAPLDLKALYMGRDAVRHWGDTTREDMARRYPVAEPHTHNALDDARAQAAIARRLLHDPH